MADDYALRVTKAVSHLMNLLGVGSLGLLAWAVFANRQPYVHTLLAAAAACFAAAFAIWLVAFAIPALLSWSETKLLIPAVDRMTQNRASARVIRQERTGRPAARLASTSLQITNARYGADAGPGYQGTWMDVTTHVADRVVNGHLNFTVSNEEFADVGPDPLPNVPKVLLVESVSNGKKQTGLFSEGSFCTLPEPT